MSTESCYYHPYTNSVSSCERCNRPVCSECIYTFKNPTLFPFKQTSLYLMASEKDEYQEKEFYSEEENNLDEELYTEELHWCYPCYYDHLYQKIAKNRQITKQILSSILISIILSLAMLLIVFAIFMYPSLNLTNLEEYYIYTIVFIISFVLSFIGEFISEKKIFQKKVVEFNKFRDDYFYKANLQNVSFPIECYYCKEIIQPESFTCLNVNCTLGEHLDENAQVIELEPVKFNSGLFDTLDELPKDPTTFENHQSKREPWD